MFFCINIWFSTAELRNSLSSHIHQPFNNMTYHLATYTFSDNFNCDNKYSINSITFNQNLMCLYTTNLVAVQHVQRFVRVYRLHPGSVTHYNLVFAIEEPKNNPHISSQLYKSYYVINVAHNPNIYQLIAAQENYEAYRGIVITYYTLTACITVCNDNYNTLILDIFKIATPKQEIHYLHTIDTHLYITGIILDTNTYCVCRANITPRNSDECSGDIKTSTVDTGSLAQGRGTAFHPNLHPPVVGLQFNVNGNGLLEWEDLFEQHITGTGTKIVAAECTSLSLNCTYITCDNHLLHNIDKYSMNIIDNTFTCDSYNCKMNVKYYRLYAFNMRLPGYFILCDINVINGQSIGTDDDAHGSLINHMDFTLTPECPCWTLPELSWVKPDGSSQVITILSVIIFPYFKYFKFITPDIFQVTWHRDNIHGEQLSVLYHFDPETLTAVPITYTEKDTSVIMCQNQCIIDTNTGNLHLLTHASPICTDEVYTMFGTLLPYELCYTVADYCQPVLPASI